MVENPAQPASVGSESEIETGPATEAITILGLRFNVQSPYSAGHVCTKGEATALNQKRLESIRNHLAVRTCLGSARRRTNDPVEAEALELARRLVRKKGQSTKENTEASRELLQSEKGDAIRAQATKRVADLKDLMVA
jgi:hypothetical protein